MRGIDTYTHKYLERETKILVVREISILSAFLAGKSQRTTHHFLVMKMVSVGQRSLSVKSHVRIQKRCIE